MPSLMALSPSSSPRTGKDGVYRLLPRLAVSNFLCNPGWVPQPEAQFPMCKVEEGLSVSEAVIGWVTKKGRAPLPSNSGAEMLGFL